MYINYSSLQASCTFFVCEQLLIVHVPFTGHLFMNIGMHRILVPGFMSVPCKVEAKFN